MKGPPCSLRKNRNTASFRASFKNETMEKVPKKEDHIS